MKKTMNETPSRTRSAWASRRARKIFTARDADAPPPRCAAFAGTCRRARPTRADSPDGPGPRHRAPAWRDCTRRTRGAPARAWRAPAAPWDESGPGRIRDDDLDADTVAHQRGQDVTHLARKKRAVLDSVLAGVTHGVGHRRRRDLDAIDVTAPAREQEADGAGARVEIDDGLAAGELAGRLDDGEEPLGLHSIGLKEGVRRHLEREPAQRFADVVAPEQEVLLRAHRDRRLLVIHVEDDAGHRRNPGVQALRHRPERHDVGRGGDDVDHRLAGAPAL